MTDICINPTADPFIRRLQCLAIAQVYSPEEPFISLCRTAERIYLWASQTSHTETTDPPTGIC